MGSDKAGLVINGQVLLERLIQTVSPLVSEIVVMLSAKQQLPGVSAGTLRRIQIVRDSVAEQGPLQGIADAIPKFSPGISAIYVLTCDLPFLDLDWLKSMKQIQRKKKTIVCAEYDGVSNPLLALYPKEILFSANEYLAMGDRSCLVLLNDKKISTLSAPKDRPNVSKDINTPEDYEKAVRYLSHTSA